MFVLVRALQVCVGRVGLGCGSARFGPFRAVFWAVSLCSVTESEKAVTSGNSSFATGWTLVGARCRSRCVVVTVGRPVVLAVLPTRLSGLCRLSLISAIGGRFRWSEHVSLCGSESVSRSSTQRQLASTQVVRNLTSAENGTNHRSWLCDQGKHRSEPIATNTRSTHRTNRTRGERTFYHNPLTRGNATCDKRPPTTVTNVTTL